MATTHFDSSYNIGDQGIIFTGKVPEVSQATITALRFRTGFNPLSFTANTDFIFTTNVLGPDGINYIEVPQGKFFATVAALKAYIDLLSL